jgi:type I restriction enzyme M protein
MLDTTTKRRIDTARDILVGKVPDPKSQVEQITIALIYKFMDDMDLDAEELGGEPSFFSGEYEKYGWRKIFNPSLGGFEMLSLYSEAILKMAQNPNLPQLFRDIFKNAYLPYRDPETLKSFLKIINDFSYDHSEKLGDAFEYLLSVLGSQGDAGQFRTPRHVIDFMTALIAPKKNETVLDPACGTAGFLISAYKHILKENSTNYDKTDPYTFEQNNVKLAEITVNGKHYKGDKLSPDDRARIIQNIKGYDISPDMVRLSLVNLYLHGFTDPHIHEYDTLTSEERWNEFYDIILANPPFMSPKGGIRPHKRFAVQSKRSEVLFVDYMAEHLTPTGKAAIIVPEGIIFQSGTAYKSLRKMLVEDNYLVGVISLPAGVFNPYSGVKTSILWLDKSLAKKTDKILFAKIENDGFDLGAQRRPIKQNDLPGVFRKLTDYRDKLMLGEDVDFENEALVSLVEKEKIAENGEFSLNGERYRTTEVISSNYSFAGLGQLCEILDSKRKPITKGDRVSGEYPYYGATGILDYVNDYIFNEKLVLIGEDGAKWDAGEKTAFIASGKYWVNNHAHVLRPDRNKLLDEYLVEVLNYMNLNRFITGITVPKLNQAKLKEIEIPLPPLSVQEEIVADIESYQKIIDGARQVVENYKPKIDIDPEWEMVELGEICNFSQGTQVDKPLQLTSPKDDYVKFLRIENYTQLSDDFRYIPKELGKNKYVSEDEVVVVRYGASAGFIGRGFDGILANNLFKVTPQENTVTNSYLYYVLSSIDYQNKFTNLTAGGAMPALSFRTVKEILIPIPERDVQDTIVAQIEKEKKLVNSNKQLIEIFEQKIKDRIAKVWGE